MFDFLTKNPQLVFFLIIFVVFVVQKILEVGRAKREAEQERAGPQVEDYYPEDESVPAPYPPYFPPPLPTESRATPPALPRAAPRVIEPDAELVRQAELEERIRRIRQTKAQMTPTAPLAPPAPHGVRQAAPRQGGVLLNRLRRPQEVRRAVLIKEILDKPLALRR